MFSKGHKIRNTGRTRFKKGMVSTFKGKHHTENSKLKMKEANKEKHLSLKTEFQKGHIPQNKGIKGFLKHTIEWKKIASKRMKGNKFALGSRHTDGWKKQMSDRISGKNHYNWKGGISSEPYSTDWTETLKRSIRERDHYICQLCLKYGNTVHHKDYDKKNCNPINLITLCGSCNTKVNFDRKYWMSYFKFYF